MGSSPDEALMYFPNKNFSNKSHSNEKKRKKRKRRRAAAALGTREEVELEMRCRKEKKKRQKRLKMTKAFHTYTRTTGNKGLKTKRHNAWPCQFSECRAVRVCICLLFCWVFISNVTSHHGRSTSARVSSMMSPLERWSGWPKPTGGGGKA